MIKQTAGRPAFFKGQIPSDGSVFNGSGAGGFLVPVSFDQREK